ncbi:MAG: preprotein translocase subunit SecE [Chloroflexi bacterium SZAS-1]|jgi:preprotein translocase subunit SecE|nr:preprotein translocase subunit SecE [Chloroflexi bacterium SZAS-1]HNP88174.1 preprotein translocase subunit SecE [Kouleothrix sp.]
MAVAKTDKEKDQNENSLLRTLREVRSEMKKVVWPTREETIRLTVVVIALSAIISLLLFTADSIFQYLILTLQNAVQ